jgi:hypothetical protein
MPAPGQYKTVQGRILAYAQQIGWTFVPRDEAERCRVLRPRWICAGRAAVITSRHGFAVPQILLIATQSIVSTTASAAKPNAPFKRGELFEIISIQIKGGGAKRPDKSEIKRLRDVAKHYKARDVVLAEWVKGNQLKFNWLVNYRADPKKAWGEVDPGVLFR